MKPVIRLKGVDIDWDVDFAKELCKISTGKSNTQDQVEDGKYPFYIRSENVVKSNKYLYDCEAVITIGDGNIGRVFHYVNGKFDLHQRCYMMTGFKKVIGPYFFHFFSAKFYDRAIKLSAKATVDSVRLNMIADMPIYYPRDNNEQKYIADYFKALDFIIQTTAKKITSLKQMKQACLVSMFPQEGETTPRVRFKGFKGEWINSILGEIFSERVEGNIDGEMLSVTMNNGIIKASENGRFDNSNSDKSHYKVVKVNDIAYNSMRMWQGASGCSEYEGIVSPAYTVVAPVDGIHSRFFAYMFKTQALIKTFRLHSQGLTSDTWNLKYPTFSQIKVYYPKSKEEQQKIASYFTSLDKQISLQEARLEKLKQIKSACLDKMFV